MKIPFRPPFRAFQGLLTPRNENILIQRRRAQFIHDRLRFVAAAFAVLTPLWIGVDVALFEWPLWGSLALLRVVASATFVVLALFYRGSRDIRTAWRGLVLLLSIPVAFFVTTHPLLTEHSASGVAAAVAAGYAFLPFVVVAGLSVFPLTALEGLLLSVPMLLGYLWAGIYGSPAFPFPSYLGALWLLILIAAVATLAAMSQLHFIIALVGQTSHDSLTGAFSRRIGEELLLLHFGNARRGKMAMSVAFIDLDDFKAINDRFGHDQGDQVLTGAAQAIRTSLRSSDVLIRWGGEEFLVLLPNCTVEGALIAIERLRGIGFGHRPDGTSVTASIGIAEWLRDGVRDTATLIDIADKRMYQAKQSGKNRVVAGVHQTLTQPASDDGLPESEVRCDSGRISTANGARFPQETCDHPQETCDRTHPRCPAALLGHVATQPSTGDTRPPVGELRRDSLLSTGDRRRIK